MTKAPSKQNQKLITILKYARDNILWKGSRTVGWTLVPEGKEKFICYSIANANNKLFNNARVPARLDAMIDKHLHGHHTMTSFLFSAEADLKHSKVARLSNKTIQTYRFMLVNHMIRLLGGKP